MISRNNKDPYDKVYHLILNAIEIIDNSNPSTEFNRRSIMAAVKVDKLMKAEERAQESLDLVMQLSLGSDICKEALSEASKDIDNISNLIAFNNESYMNIMRYISK
jgi:hypothetical protein